MEMQNDVSLHLQNTFDNAIIGCVVLTNYNNKTYRIDEVDYSSNPRSTFPKKKKGETTHISYIDYYQEVCDRNPEI